LTVPRSSADRRRNEGLRAEVAALEADDVDRKEMQEIALLMEALRAEG
jgi:hypothetical protein